MMEGNENKKFNAPLAYAILGVTVLVIAVAGSAYAFFQAQATATNEISGETLDVSLGVTLRKVSAATGNLVPIYDGTVSGHDSQLGQAASHDPSCEDKQGYTVCQIYEIIATNSGSDATSVTIEVNLTGSTNIKWANMTNQTTPGTVHAKTDTTVEADVSLAASGSAGNSATRYIMVYLMNTGTNQTTADGNKTFGGTVSVRAATGQNVEAKF